MEQATKHKSSRMFTILCIVLGVILILFALIGGVSFLIALAKGILARTLSGIRNLVLNIVLEFCVPFIGGVILILAGLRIMKFQDAVLDREMVSDHRKKILKQKERIMDVFLNDDEKRLMELLKEDPKGALQSDLVIKTGYSKVKMHRMLKSLENRNLIRRGRFGITNKVFINKY